MVDSFPERQSMKAYASVVLLFLLGAGGASAQPSVPVAAEGSPTEQALAPLNLDLRLRGTILVQNGVSGSRPQFLSAMPTPSGGQYRLRLTPGCLQARPDIDLVGSMGARSGPVAAGREFAIFAPVLVGIEWLTGSCK